MSEIILYDYWRSSASYRVRIALNIAGLSYKTVNIDLLKKEQKAETHLKRNPQGLVPVIEIDGQVFTQSLAILEYLNTTRHLDILPSEPISRAKITALAYTLAVDVHPVCNISVVGQATKNAVDKKQESEDWMKHFIHLGLYAFEKQLEQFKLNPFVNSEKPTLTEICLIPQLYNANRWGIDYSNCPHIIKLEEACASVTAFADAYPNKL